jgi:hypothetical protein
MQPNYYAAPTYSHGSPYQYHNGAYTQPQPYAREIHHLTTYDGQRDDGGYWKETRNDALRLLGAQGVQYVDGIDTRLSLNLDLC